MSRPDDVLHVAGDQALAAGHKMLDHVALAQACEAQGLTHDEWFGGLVELREQQLVQCGTTTIRSPFSS